MIRNCGSEITRYYAGSLIFENILSIRALEWLVILVGCKIKGINELYASETKNSLVGLCSLTLKPLGRKIDFCSLEILVFLG